MMVRARHVVLLSAALAACGHAAAPRASGGSVSAGARAVSFVPGSATPDADFRQRPPYGLPEPPFVAPVIREGHLSNGLRILLVEDHHLPIVALNLSIDRGAADAPPGVAEIAMRMLFAGTRYRAQSEIGNSLAEAGAVSTAWVNLDGAGMNTTLLASGAQRVVGLLGDMFLNSTLPPDAIERERAQKLASMRAKLPEEALTESVAGVLYPADHPYHLPIAPDERSLRAIQRDDLVRFLKMNLEPDHVVLAAAGDVRWEDLSSYARAAFGGWTGVASAPARLPAAASPPQADDWVVVIDRPGATQSEIRVAALCPSRDSADRAPFSLLGTALGGIFTSRLNLNLREAHGYSYSPNTRVDFRRGSGIFMARATVALERTNDALGQVVSELQRMGGERLSDEELGLAKTAFLRIIPQRFSAVRATASTITDLANQGLPLDYYATLANEIRRVDQDQLRRLAGLYLAPERLRVVVMGDSAALREQLKGHQVKLLHVDLAPPEASPPP